MTHACPHCQSTVTVKNGVSYHGHQRYLCRACGRTFGLTNHRRIDDGLREEALRLYVEGVSLRGIERLLGINHNSVMNWVRQEVAGKALSRVDASEVSVIEADELWSFIGQKNAKFGSGGLLIALPKELSAGRWVVARPRQPKDWLRRFLKASTLLMPVTTGAATGKSSPKSSTCAAKPKLTRSKT